jgi:vesicle coat complex subunit
VDFVRKAVRAIGRCAIKVEQSAERCVSTLLDLIQTKVCWLFVCVYYVKFGIPKYNVLHVII